MKIPPLNQGLLKRCFLKGFLPVFLGILLLGCGDDDDTDDLLDIPEVIPAEIVSFTAKVNGSDFVFDANQSVVVWTKNEGLQMTVRSIGNELITIEVESDAAGTYEITSFTDTRGTYAPSTGGGGTTRGEELIIEVSDGSMISGRFSFDIVNETNLTGPSWQITNGAFEIKAD